MVHYSELSGMKAWHPPISNPDFHEIEFTYLIHMPLQMKPLLLPQLPKSHKNLKMRIRSQRFPLGLTLTKNVLGRLVRRK
jgi:hypothetical protein